MSAAGPRQKTLFEGARLDMQTSIALTLQSLTSYLEGRSHVAIAWSGGKDSTALVTFVVWAILAGKVPAPRTLTILYADTRQELTPLWHAAQGLMEELRERAEALRERGTELTVQTVVAPVPLRFLVYMLGLGVPPPNNTTFRWCTEKLKIDPMERALEGVAVAHGLGEFREVERAPRASVKGAPKTKRVYVGHGTEKILVLTGVRQGESAVRDGRITLSCAKKDAECGQGWYQETLPAGLCDTLAPLLHWRVCHVWEWLRHWTTQQEFGDFTTALVAEAYGGDEAEESGARTGCVGCPLVSEDRALERLVVRPQWAYLAPLRELRELYESFRSPLVRLRQRAGERTKGGKLAANQQRMGPLTLAARKAALAKVLDIQRRINDARPPGALPVDIVNAEELAEIERLHAAKAYPRKWTGEEPLASEPFDAVSSDGRVQFYLFRDEVRHGAAADPKREPKP